MSRLTSSRRAGTVRTLVAVGTVRLASMFATIREAAPRNGVASSLSGSLTTGGAGAGAGAFAWAAGWGGGGGTVVGEEFAPALADRAGVGQEAVVHVVDQPCIGAEGAPSATDLGHEPTLPAGIGFLGQAG